MKLLICAVLVTLSIFAAFTAYPFLVTGSTEISDPTGTYSISFQQPDGNGLYSLTFELKEPEPDTLAAGEGKLHYRGELKYPSDSAQKALLKNYELSVGEYEAARSGLKIARRDRSAEISILEHDLMAKHIRVLDQLDGMKFDIYESGGGRWYRNGRAVSCIMEFSQSSSRPKLPWDGDCGRPVPRETKLNFRHEENGDLVLEESDGNNMLAPAAGLRFLKERPLGSESSGTPAQHEEGATTYTITSADDLYRIARKLGVSSMKLLQLNGIKDPTKVQAGQVLKVPAEAD